MASKVLNYSTLVKSIPTSDECLYLISGNEYLLVDELINLIKKKFNELSLGINYILVDENTIENLSSEIEMFCFGYDKKLIIVNSTSLFKKDGRRKDASPIQEKIANYINDNMDIIKDSCILVFNEIEVDKTVVYDAILKNGIVAEIKEQSPKETLPLLKEECKKRNINVTDFVLNSIIENSGTNLSLLLNELDKYENYAGESKTITQDMVNKLGTKQLESEVFKLTNYLAENNVNKALEVLDDFIYQKIAFPIIIKTLYSHFKELYLTILAVKYKQDVVGALELSEKRAWLAGKFRKEASMFGEEKLRGILNDLCDLDYKSKVGLLDPEIGIRSILCNYCSKK